MFDFEEFYDAAVYGEKELIEDVLKKYPNAINQKDKFGFTALHGVVGEEQFEMALYLIENGANVNSENDEGITPIHIAANPEMVNLLFLHKADINHKAKDGSTPLHTQASESEGIDCLKALLDLGANPNVKNKRGETPIDIAHDREEEDKVNLFSKYKN